ncbi:hypothetical protein [Streptomyces sp. NBC_01373]|uniref:hypothetical protein n=1 Tax=Streptomyces sp. NBC_01373 TaxID=2903843 RepID=UPI002258D220|nr:hypothetical protein [Streptomyces sp. NBC_01373]MCX4703886.1 hypothetical protein [Streptomyces sp. NBC_01373]
MTYFQLRKRDPDPDTLDDEIGEEEASSDETDDAPVGLVGALWAGISGPGAWLTARGWPGAAWTLYVGSAWAVGFYGGWTAAGLAAVWLAAVLAFIPREYKERVAARIEGWNEARGAELDEAAVDTAADTEEHQPADPRTVLIGWLDDLTRGRSGIHLDELHQTLAAHPQLAGLKRPEMRAWLDRHHITVERTLRVGGVPGRSGVSRRTVEALLRARPPLPESGPVDSPVHASDLPGSPAESGVEWGGERAV